MVRKLRHTEIGDIPVDWKLQTFDETFRVLSNNTLSRENLNNRSGAVRNIHYGDILTKFPEVLDCNEEEIPYVNDLSLLSSSTQLLQEGDIVIADTAEDETVGKVTEVQNLGDSKLVAGLHTIPCRVKKGDFAPGWLGYYMNSNLFHNQILPYITGIKVSSISKGAISETLILVPPFDEQEKIVQSLNEVQLLMTAETKVVNKMKFVKNGCLSKMFPKNDATVPEMRLPGFTDTWEQRKLGDYCDMYNGDRSSKYPNAQDMVAEGIPFINAGDLENGHVNLTTCNKISREKYDDLGGAKLQIGDIVYCLRGTLGKNAYIDNFPEGTVASSLVAIRPKNIDGRYLFHVLNSDIEYSQRVVHDEGAAQPNLSAKSVSGFMIPIPHIDEQKKVSKYFDNLDYLITLHQRTCDKYLSIKKGMMSDLLTGKIRLV